VTPEPFPHLVLDWWFTPELCQAIADEFPTVFQPGWREYRKQNEVKYEGGPSMWGDAACEYFDQLEGRTGDLEEMFAIPNLSMEFVGGGYHLIPPGGRLAMHADFNRSPDTDLYRRLNVLTYLNPDWDDAGGHLRLGDPSSVVINPEMGRTVIFATSATSWHGHPVPTVHRWRKSIAAYFFSPEPPPDYQADQSTVWL
jgi:Rps23 Pro-64 3,4-dihydroxylase Tpa1-like proline 4-hydroxylase